MKSIVWSGLACLLLFASCNTTKNASSNEKNTTFFACAGNEPFWDLKMDKTTITFNTMEGSMEFPYSAPRGQEGHYTFICREGEDILTVNVKKEKCTDSMSGKVFPYKASVILNGQTYLGCAE
jgi:uncharacterized membrane protein